MSAEPTVVIRLDGDGSVYRPGETLSGQYWIRSLAPIQVKAIEVSVLWHSEGKGDEDMAVHEFWRRDADESHPIDPGQPERFRTTLPNSPLVKRIDAQAKTHVDLVAGHLDDLAGAVVDKAQDTRPHLWCERKMRSKDLRSIRN